MNQVIITDHKSNRKAAATWLLQSPRFPTALSMFFVALVFVAWFLACRIADDGVRRRLASDQIILANVLASRAEIQQNAIIRMGDRWNDNHGTPRALWESDARAYLRDIPGLIELEWLSGTSKIRWRVIKDPALAGASADNQVNASQDMTVTYTIRLHDNSRLSGVFFVNQLLRLPSTRLFGDRFSYTISMPNDHVNLYTGHITDHTNFQAFGKTFRLSLLTRPAYLNRIYAGITFWTCFSALLLGLLIAVILRSMLTERVRSRQLALLVNEMSDVTKMLEESVNEVMIVDRETLKIIYANRGARENLGYELDELQAMDVFCIKPELTREQYEQELRVVRSGEVRKVVFTAKHRRQNGTFYDAQIHIQNARYKETDVFFQIVIDISAHSELDRLKNDFTSVVSHELRTPLTSIRGSLGLLAGPLSVNLDEKSRKLIDVANRNCERLIVLINDILDIDKLESGQMKLTMKSERAYELVEQAIELNRPYCEKYMVDVELICDARYYETCVRLDASRFVQILSNLISNAAKFSEPGTIFQIHIYEESAELIVAVRDFGHGIPEQYHGRIFQKFSQIEPTSTRSKGGSGLGLHICKNLVEQMKGRIYFTSIPQSGTTFYTAFPLVSDEVITGREWTPPVTSLMLPERRSRHALPLILHIEDDQDFFVILRSSLENTAHILWAQSLAQARELLESQTFDLIIMDLVLPDGAGSDLYGDILSSSSARAPIVIVSAVDQSTSLNERVVAVFTKSRTREQLIIDTIASVLSSKEVSLP